MNFELFGINFVAAQYAFCLVLVGIASIAVMYRTYRLTVAVNQLAIAAWRYYLIPHYSPSKTFFKSILLLLALISLCIALLRPTWGLKQEVVEQEGRELFVGLDISRSMLAADVQPNRLTFAKAKISRLLRLLGADRVGLLVFAGDAFVQCPLTRDTAAFNLFLDAVDAQTISSGTTALDQALTKMIAVFSGMATRKNKVIVIFTDGEDFSSNLRAVKQKAHEMGIHIFTYGVGTAQGAPVPVINEQGVAVGHQQDEQGAVVISRLNEGILRNLSTESGGVYITPTQEDEDLRLLVKYVEKYEKEKFEDKEVSTKQERYYYFLIGAFVCLLIEWIL